MNKKLVLLFSIVNGIIGVLAVAAFVILLVDGYEVFKWLGALLLSAFMIGSSIYIVLSILEENYKLNHRFVLNFYNFLYNLIMKGEML